MGRTMRKRNLMMLGIFLLTAQLAVADEDYREYTLRLEQKEFDNIKGLAIGDAARLKAIISQEGQYESNVFLTPSDEKHDYISITSPKFLLDVPIGQDERHLFQLKYGADISAFSHYKSQNYVNQDALARLDLTLPFGYMHFLNNFEDTVERAATEFTDRRRRTENLSQAILGIEQNKLSYEAGYSHFFRDYRDSQFDTLNYTEDFISGTAYYQLFPKTKTLVEYDHGIIQYPDDSTRDGDYDQIRGGFKYDLTGKTSGLVKLGYQDRSYDTPSRSGFAGFVAEVGLMSALTERTSFELRYLNTAVESIDSNNNYYNLNSISADITQDLAGNFSILGSARLDMRDYPENDPTINENREDWVNSESITLRYNIKERGRVNLGYQYTQDISNLDVAEYKDNLISLRFDLVL